MIADKTATFCQRTFSIRKSDKSLNVESEIVLRYFMNRKNVLFQFELYDADEAQPPHVEQID